MRVALIQMNSQNDYRHNLEQAGIFLADAARQGATYALLPENFAFFGSEQEKKSIGSTIDEAARNFLRESAAKLKMTITGGGMPVLASSGKYYNAAITFAADGSELHRYDKLHLFDVAPGDNVTYQESRGTEYGAGALALLDLPPFSFGMTICYDVRFPVLYRRYARLGANVLCVPAAFTKLTGAAHWHTLLRARAIENTCYVIAAAQTGSHFSGRETFGHSIVCDPWGEIVAELPERPGVLIADLSIERVREVRARMPSLSHDQI